MESIMLGLAACVAAWLAYQGHRKIYLVGCVVCVLTLTMISVQNANRGGRYQAFRDAASAHYQAILEARARADD